MFTLIAKTLYRLYFAGFDQVLFLAPAYSLMYPFCPWPDLVFALIVIHISCHGHGLKLPPLKALPPLMILHRILLWVLDTVAC